MPLVKWGSQGHREFKEIQEREGHQDTRAAWVTQAHMERRVGLAPRGQTEFTEWTVSQVQPGYLDIRVLRATLEIKERKERKAWRGLQGNLGLLEREEGKEQRGQKGKLAYVDLLEHLARWESEGYREFKGLRGHQGSTVWWALWDHLGLWVTVGRQERLAPKGLMALRETTDRRAPVAPEALRGRKVYKV